jgi:S1-C subfamily serine protease
MTPLSTASNNPFYVVQWSQGMVQKGSSGGGLFNSKRQLIGVASGGAVTCNHPNGPDLYGRFDWEFQDKLSKWLSPTN